LVWILGDGIIDVDRLCLLAGFFCLFANIPGFGGCPGYVGIVAAKEGSFCSA
jgi:hypothetical protein